MTLTDLQQLVLRALCEDCDTRACGGGTTISAFVDRAGHYSRLQITRRVLKAGIPRELGRVA